MLKEFQVETIDDFQFGSSSFIKKLVLSEATNFQKAKFLRKKGRRRL